MRRKRQEPLTGNNGRNKHQVSDHTLFLLPCCSTNWGPLLRQRNNPSEVAIVSGEPQPTSIGRARVRSRHAPCDVVRARQGIYHRDFGAEGQTTMNFA